MSAAYYRLKKYRQKQSAEAEVSTSRSDVPNFEQHEIENFNLSLEMPLEVSVGSVSNNSLSLSHHTNIRNHDSNNYSNHLLNILDSSLEYNVSPDPSSLHYESPLSSPSSQHSSHMDNSENHGHFDNNITAIVPSLREKLRNFAVRLRTNLTVEIIENLLQILRSAKISIWLVTNDIQ